MMFTILLECRLDMPSGNKVLFLVNLIFIFYGLLMYVVCISFNSIGEFGNMSYSNFFNNLVKDYPISIFYCLLLISHFFSFMMYIYNTFALLYNKKVYYFKTATLFQLLLFPWSLIVVPMNFVEYLGREEV